MEPESQSEFQFDHFVALCGLSLFPEEYRGDLDAAWEYLDQARAQNTTQSDPNIQAEYHRCSSIYAILTGNIANAYTHLQTLHDLLDKINPEWGLRYTNYKLLADYTRRFPPGLRFYHENGLPLNIPMLGGILGPNDISATFMENIQKYMPRGLPRDQALAQILNVVMWAPFNIRHLTNTFHELAVGGDGYTPDESPGPVIAQQAQNLVRLRATAETNGAHTMAGYLSRLVVEFHVACKSPETVIMLDDLYGRCERVGDEIGMGNAKILEGDGLFCPPFTSPLVLGLVILDSNGVLGESMLWDPVENELELEYSSEVQGCYDSALEFFRSADCKRGQAAVLLRQGCCLHTAGRQRRSSDQSVLEYLYAETKFQEAVELFGRDEASVHLVRAHQILVSISKGNPVRAKSSSREIGEWCARAKNEHLGHIVGTLFMRFARQEWSLCSNLDTSQQAWECAYEIFMPLGDVVPQFQTLVCRASMQHEMFNSAEAQLLMQEAVAKVDEVREFYQDRIQSAPKTPHGEPDRILLQTNKCSLLWSFNTKIGHVYARSDQPRLYLEWYARMRDWLENDADFLEWCERLEDPDSTPNETYAPEDQPATKGYKGFWRKGLDDVMAAVLWAPVDAKWQRLLGEGDILGAEEALGQFARDDQGQGATYVRSLCRIMAYHRLGEQAKGKEILDLMSDDLLFDGHLEAFKKGIATRSSLPLFGLNALTFTVFAGDMERGQRLVRMIREMSPTFFTTVTDDAMGYAQRLGNYAAIMKDVEPEICFRKLLTARSYIETRRKQTADPDARVWSSEELWTGQVYLDLAHICLDAGDHSLPLQLLEGSEYVGHEYGRFEGLSWTDHALLFVEMSRARAVLESLQAQAARTPGMSKADKAADLSEAVHKRRLLRSLLSLEKMTADQEKEVTQLQADIKVLEDNGSFSHATKFIETANSTVDPKLLYQSIDDDAVVIEATFGPRSSIAFAVTKDGVQHAHPSSTNRVDIRKPVMRAMQIMRNLTGYIGEEEQSKKKVLNELCEEISEYLIVPFADIIRTKPHVIFSVSDPLTAFPFSVLPFDGKPLVQQAVVSQVPSLTVLYYLCQRKSASVSPTVSVLAKSPLEGPSGSTRADNEANLHMAGIEAVSIARMFATWPIEASQMTRKDFQHYVEGESLIMHIGTHGDINYRSPLLSSISIGQGQEFRVVDMSVIQSKANLLVFAACLSGFGKATTGSEVLGFSHVVLSTGCQAYIGSLWEVSDFGSMLLMTRFYEHLKASPHRAVAEAMRAAQLDLMQLDTEKAGTLLDQMLDDWSGSGTTGQNPAEFVPDAEFLLLTLKMILGQLDWSSPFYWAPFTLVGYGGFRFSHSSGEDQGNQSI